MAKYLRFAGAIAAFYILAGCICMPSNRQLPVTLRPQETGMWCWAASGEMAMEFLGQNVTQCDEANKRFGRNDCCNSPVPNQCVHGGWPEFPKYGFTASMTNNAALTWAQVKDQIGCKGKPFVFTWSWCGDGGHVMVITGYSVVNGVNMVSVNDPWAPNVGDQYVITYDAYVTDVVPCGIGGSYSHWNDYYDITYTGGK